MKQRVKTTKARKSRANDDNVEAGSGNVYADLDFRDAEERLLKAYSEESLMEAPLIIATHLIPTYRTKAE
ncbi:MAG: hypothetical protein ACREBG_09450 [Pyrinomonadaceae bacterium]